MRAGLRQAHLVPRRMQVSFFCSEEKLQIEQRKFGTTRFEVGS